jgi:hypothetical protein
MPSRLNSSVLSERLLPYTRRGLPTIAAFVPSDDVWTLREEHTSTYPASRRDSVNRYSVRRLTIVLGSFTSWSQDNFCNGSKCDHGKQTQEEEISSTFSCFLA